MDCAFGSLQHIEAGHEIAIVRQVIRQQIAEPLHVVSPIAMKFARHREPIHQLNSGGRHPLPGGLLHGNVERARGIRYDENVIASFDGR